MDTHVQSAMHKREASIVGLVIMMRVVIREMVFVPGLASTALHAPSLQDVRNVPIAQNKRPV
jgi:hypothetical protein